MFTILVVEDDASLNKMICAKLSKEQYKAIPAFDGEEALEVMDKEHIDLIISDIMMPKMDGYELTKLLRDTSCHLPILMITAKGQLEDMERGLWPERMITDLCNGCGPAGNDAVLSEDRKCVSGNDRVYYDLHNKQPDFHIEHIPC